MHTKLFLGYCIFRVLSCDFVAKKDCEAINLCNSVYSVAKQILFRVILCAFVTKI